MKLFAIRKDGGSESTVTGYWLVEAKRLLSVCLLRFDGLSREAFHSHAFNCLSWVISGELVEEHLDGRVVRHPASLIPFVTRRTDFHKVHSAVPTSWVLSFRGPWAANWFEYLPDRDKFAKLASGRRILRFF